MPIDVEEEIAERVTSLERLIILGGTVPAVADPVRAKIQIFKTAPREVPKLKCEIALKQKALDNCETYPQRDIRMAELDALKNVLVTINMAAAGVEKDTPEKMKKRIEEWQQALEFFRKRRAAGDSVVGVT